MVMVRATLLMMLAALTTPSFGAAWQATPVSEVPGLPRVVWELRSIVGPAETIEVAESMAYTVQFGPRRQLRITADCNRGSGSYRQDGQSIAIGPIRTTRMPCAPGSLDQQFLTALQGVEQWLFEDDHLLLEDSTGATRLTFSPQLSGVNWEWREFQAGNDRVLKPAKLHRYQIRFLADGLFWWEAACSSGQGTYRVNGASLDVLLMDRDADSCPESALDREFIQVMAEATSHRFEDGNLYLSLPADAGVAQFVARPADSDLTTPAATPQPARHWPDSLPYLHQQDWPRSTEVRRWRGRPDDRVCAGGRAACRERER